MPRIDPSQVPVRTGSSYPAEFAAQMDGRAQRKLGDAGGLTKIGVNLVDLQPGAMSSLRHWHQEQDEFVMVTLGTCTLIDDHGETELIAGDCAAFPKGDPNGHHLVNRTGAPAQFLVAGTRTPTEVGHYSDVDLRVTAADGAFSYTRSDGSPLPDPT
jgi:uncharacterized cupin superfamily protein